MSDPQVVVRGTAVVSADPDYADLHVHAHAQARDRQTAMERCAARQAEVDRVIAAAGDAIETAETTGISVHVPWREHGPAEPVAGVRTRLSVVHLDAVGELVVALGTIDGVTLSGPHWRLREDSPAYERARLDAVTDAVRRARQYAAAFGAELTGLVQIADEGMSGRGAERAMATAALVGVDESGGPGLDVTPVRQDVHGAVEVRFAMSRPDPTVFAR
jgi:uncharacterized protein